MHNRLRISNKIEIRQTQAMGKGFFAKELITKGEQLMYISYQQFISCESFVDYSQFSNLKNSETISKKTLLAYFLAAVSVTKNKLPEYEPILEYIAMLPKKINALICWSQQQLKQFNNQDLINRTMYKKQEIAVQFKMIQSQISKVWQQEKQKWQYRMFLNQSQFSKITLQDIIYFTSVIQSRAVHYICTEDPRSNVGALARYLQIFNHSPFPQCEVEGSPSFTVRAIRNIHPNQEVFVRYGKFSQLKILEMYGFLQSLETPILENQNYRQKVAAEYNKKIELEVKPTNFLQQEVTNTYI